VTICWKRWLAVLMLLSSPSQHALAEPEQRVVLWDLEYSATEMKYGVEASVFAIGDPVHETITLHALIGAGLLKPGSSKNDPPAVNFLRGVFWNDDPCADLFRDKRSLKPSSGVAWYKDFWNADHEADPKKFGDLECRLLGRSHFGNLQFLHGMANADGEDPSVTRSALLAWARYAYNLAIGVTSPDTTLRAAQAPIADVGDMAPLELFKAPNFTVISERAIGSLAHLLQDSYARGHVRRQETPHGSVGAIEQFHSYAHQNHDKHKQDDMWRTGGTDLEKIRGVRGGTEALAESTALFKFYASKTAWPTVEKYLLLGPLRFADKTYRAGP
jgi:hypothetical protein